MAVPLDFRSVLDFNVKRDVHVEVYDNNSEKESLYLASADRILLRSRDFPIKKFRLGIPVRINIDNGHGDNQHYLQNWVSTAASAEELELHLSVSSSRFSTRVLFRWSHSYSNMLVLKLNCPHMGSVDSCLFPKLKVLHLFKVFFEDDQGGSLENFLSSCPILEELVCREVFNSCYSPWKICVPTLTRLVVQCSDIDRHTSFTDLVLETPALEYFHFKHVAYLDSIVSADLCNLSRADVKCLVRGLVETCGSRLMKLLANLSRVKFLNLSCDEMIYHDAEAAFYSIPWRGLVEGFDYSCLNELPVFHNLVSLELRILSRDCVLLPHLLRKFPNLNRIDIEKNLDIKEDVVEACWMEPLQVPICLSTTLSSFYFQGFEGFKVEVELVEYITEHGMVLKNMTLVTSSRFKELKAKADAVLQELPMARMGSETCEFHLS